MTAKLLAPIIQDQLHRKRSRDATVDQDTRFRRVRLPYVKDGAASVNCGVEATPSVLSVTFILVD